MKYDYFHIHIWDFAFELAYDASTIGVSSGFGAELVCLASVVLYSSVCICVFGLCYCVWKYSGLAVKMRSDQWVSQHHRDPQNTSHQSLTQTQSSAQRLTGNGFRQKKHGPEMFSCFQERAQTLFFKERHDF